MARFTHLTRCAGPVALGIVLAMGPFPLAAAQPATPCRPGDSLLSLGKAAFFRSIERGAFAIGERTLEDLTDGLGGASVAKPAGGTRRTHATAPVQARGALFPSATEATLVTALKAYVENPSSDAADEALQSFLVSAVKILFETPPAGSEAGRVGLVLEATQFSNGGSTFAVQDMVNETRRLKLEDSLFGGGPDLQMGRFDKLLGVAPFFKAPVIADTRNVDRNNLAIIVKKEQELRALWFVDYRASLATAAGAPSAAQITDALNVGWPILQKFWAFKRTEVFVDRAQTAFGTEMRQVNERVTTESLPSGECDPKGR